MSRQLEQEIEDRARKQKDAAVFALYGGLTGAVAHGGGELYGFSVKMQEGDCLMTLRAIFPAGRQVAFVGSDDLVGVFVKAVREARTDQLRWREDNFKVG